MQLIAKQTVGSGGAASVTFSNIPQTFTDLKILASTRSAASSNGDSFRVYFNGDTGNISVRELRGSGSAAASYTISYAQAGYTSDALITANTFNNAEIYIPNYTSSNYKSSSADNVYENNATDAFAVMSARLWSSTAAVTSITLKPNDAGFVEFSEFYLYGISSSSTQNTSVPLASGGDIITTDGSYWYHTFLYSGTFTPLKALTCDYLVVAGGGGGGIDGGGGAGGYRSFSAQALTSSTNYTCTVGAGGGGALNGGLNGTDSSFNSTTATAGGGGAGYTSAGKNGGSAGGGGRFYSAGGTGNTPSTSPSQGNNGGSSGSNFGGSGGGGAGAVGANATGNNGANGGIGVASSISGSSVYYAGGGGGGGNWAGSSGGTGGTGGGGNGAAGTSSGINPEGANGTANTGGGGGGLGVGPVDQSSVSGSKGGSGIIIVRYAVV